MSNIIYGSSRSEGVNWTDRLDPLYELEYSDMLSAQWTAERLHQPTLRVTESGVVKPVVDSVPFVTKRPWNKTHSGRAIMVFAVLSEFNQMTTMQIASLLQLEAGYVESTLEELMLAGIVLRLDAGSDVNRDKSIRGIWRVLRSGDNPRLREWVSALTPLEYALISNGVPVESISGSNQPTATQHNLMTNELMLRAMEVNPAIIGAWGERHARMIDMYEQARFDESVARRNIADGILVTRNGKVIVIESSGSSLVTKKNGQNKNSLVHKAAAWVAVCAYSELDIRVVFVDISNRPDVDRLRKYVSIGVEIESQTYVSRNAYRQEGAAKIYVADGREWFPAARALTDDFAWMRAYNAFSHHQENIIDDDDLVTDQNSDIVKNTLAALHVPSWIKNMPDMKIA